jgi:penicillin-binding protein 1A
MEYTPTTLSERIADRWQRTSGRARGLLFGGLGLVVLLGAAWHFCFFMGCPDVHRLASYQPGGAPVLVDRHGKEFANLTPLEGEVVTLKSLPKHVGEAFIAVEDRRFREHGATDFRRILGALVANVKSGEVEEGSSTITMQLARNVFPERLPGNKRTLGRKLLEVRVAQEIEDEFSKDEILEMYLNHIYFGNGARGVEAAARHYFGRNAKDLTLDQAALLAALPKAPTHYDPRRKAKAARERRDLILGLMEEQKRITPQEAEAARQAPLGVVAKRRARKAEAPFAAYFVEEVRRQLEDILGPDLYDDKLRIHTTLDRTAQSAAEEELERQLAAIEGGKLGRFSGPRYAAVTPPGEEETPYLQGAVVVLEAKTGDVLAWVGGRDFNQSRFDRVKSAQRQAGSAFKPFIYATALQSGRTLNQRITDEPLKVSLDRRRSWEPRNFDLAFDGPITLRDALVRSKNIPAIKLAQEVGYSNVAAFAEEAGVEPPIPQEPSMALGTVSVSPLELTAAFSAFANLGDGVKPRLLSKVVHPDGRVLWEDEAPRTHRVMGAGVAYLVTDALREALWRGTGTAVPQAGFRGPAAGKTGTTNDGADAWFVGYTPDLVGTVWLGFDERRTIMPKATGGRLAAPAWARIMSRIYKERPRPEGWARPSDVVDATVDSLTGFVLAAGCQSPAGGTAYREVFLNGTMPVSVCPSQGQPEMLDLLTADAALPDYESGMETGLPDDVLDALREAQRERERAANGDEITDVDEATARRDAEAAAGQARLSVREVLGPDSGSPSPTAAPVSPRDSQPPVTRPPAPPAATAPPGTAPPVTAPPATRPPATTLPAGVPVGEEPEPSPSPTPTPSPPVG